LPANDRWKNWRHKHSFGIGFWSSEIYRKAISQNWTFGLESNRSQTPTQSLTSFWWPGEQIQSKTIIFLYLIDSCFVLFDLIVLALVFFVTLNEIIFSCLLILYKIFCKWTKFKQSFTSKFKNILFLCLNTFSNSKRIKFFQFEKIDV
jgi:hypothetical protein